MTSSGISLSALLSQVDKLEGELKSLTREVDKGEQYVKTLEDMIERDMNEYAEKEKTVSDIGKDIRELEDREHFLKNAIENANQSSRLLSQMESDAKAKLNQEVNRTNELFHKLSGQASHYKDKLAKEEEKLKQIPAFQNYLAMEERVAQKKLKLAEEQAKVNELQKLADKRKGGKTRQEPRDWSTFVKECVNLAELWLKKRREFTEANSAPIRSSSPTDIELPHDSDEDMEAEADKRDVEDGEILPDIAKVSLDPNHSGSASVSIPKNGEHSKSYKLFPIPMQMDVSKATDDEILMKDLSVEAAAPVEPPTPKTKSLHLKLGASLLTLKKSRQQSRGPSPVTSASDVTKPHVKSPQADLNFGSKVETMDVDSDKGSKDTVNDDKAKTNSVGKHSSKPRSRPSSPIPRLLNAVFSSSSSKPSEEVPDSKQKSFKLGLPSLSLFPKKKPSKQPEPEDVKKALTPEKNQVKSTQPLKAPILLQLPKPRANTSPLSENGVDVSDRQSTPVPQINFVSPESTSRLTAPKLSLVPPPQLPTRKADTPRPKVTPKNIPLNQVSKSTSPKKLAKNDIQEDKQEVRMATPVKRGCTSPRKDVDSPIKMVNPLLRMRATPKKETQRPESSPEVFQTPPTSAVSHSFLEKSPRQGASGGFFDEHKAMSVSADLFGGSEEQPLGREESFLGGGETQKSHVSSGSGFFSSNPGDGKVGSFFDADGTEDEDQGSFSLFFDGEKDEGGSGGFSLF